VFATTTSERLIWNVSLVPIVTIISNGCLYYSTGPSWAFDLGGCDYEDEMVGLART
jgi:hypothetical protein